MPYRDRERYLESQREAYRRDREAYKRRALRRQYEKRYGLTPEAFAALVESQVECPICSRPFVWNGPQWSKPHVDHDHATGVVRGLLCGRCNVGLGSFDDDEGRMRKAAEYLVKHRK